MCLKPAMDSAFSPKPLNPNANSWFPDAQNHSSSPEKPPQAEEPPLSLLPYQICTVSPPPKPTEMFSLFPNQVLYSASAACPVAYPDYFYYQYPWFQLYYQPVIANGGLVMVESENDVMKEKMLDSSEELKGLLGISEVHERPKGAMRFVPPRLRRGYFEVFRGKKKLPKKLWKPKISDAGAGPVKKIVASASHQNKEFRFCNYTTVMIKNIPNKYRRNSFIGFLDKSCFEHQLEYDFLYLPMDFKTGANLGYAFVNFTSASAAKKMEEAFQGYKWGCVQTPQGTYTSNKMLEISWARIQGKDALVRHFARSNFTCDNFEYLPVVITPPRNGFISISSLTTVGCLLGCSKSFKN